MTKHFNEVYQCLRLLGLTSLLVLGTSKDSYARPTFGADCASCHNNAGGNVDISPDPLSVLIGETGQLTFDVTDIPVGEAALSINGLQAAGLGASVLTAGWTELGDGRWALEGITTTGSIMADLGTAADGTSGSYDIEVFLAGGPSGERWSALTSFVIQTAVIPEPASIALLAVIGGTFGIRCMTRRRRQRAQRK